ncbi:dihydrofolate reductase [Arthrobacter ginsengisoli]|uniref:Dihydrofolate reductase n=1 Tax=Arthrobacter ginsengisoli TaxID=1356565 RepID=A0ABU1UC84_9MICC|nr:deaminase [Arthrobacter ginsengisoli]MDR7082807.1 dihydrofolate reductase [Arthrobacter ginsengisoli]
MRKLIVQQWVTVDNIAAEEDGGLSFVSAEPFSETTNNAFKARVMGFIDSVDTMILGANTYAQSKGYWPYADDQGEYGEKLNNLTKFVASSKLDDAPWGDFPAATVTRDPAATIRELKGQSGKDLWLWGSLKLMHSLQAGWGIRAYFELTVSREVAMWKRGVAEVDVNREAPARAPPQVALD